MSHDAPQKIEYGSFKSYLLGLFLSILLTMAAYFFRAEVFLVAIFAILQAGVQLIFFLNLTREPKPRWNLIIFLFMIMIVAIIVFGSIWIMNNLNYNLME